MKACLIKSRTKLVFFGTPDFVLPIPQILIEAGFELVAVVTNPDKPTGSKQILTPSPIKVWAAKHQIQIIDSPSIIRIIEQVRHFKPDLGILAAYGKIIPKELINIFPKGILVVHPSLLPKYRGPSPVQAAILNGERKTGVSIIKMDEKIDHGPIISQFSEKIKPNDTAETLYQRLFQKAAEVLVTILPAWIEGKIVPRPQNHSQATFTRLLKKEDGFIPPEILKIAALKPTLSSKYTLGPEKVKPTPENLERFIRAMTTWPGAWTEILIPFRKGKPRRYRKEKKRLKILRAHLEEGKLIFDLVQLEGKKPVTFKQFQAGYPKVKIV